MTLLQHPTCAGTGLGRDDSTQSCHINLIHSSNPNGSLSSGPMFGISFIFSFINQTSSNTYTLPFNIFSDSGLLSLELQTM